VDLATDHREPTGEAEAPQRLRGPPAGEARPDDDDVPPSHGDTVSFGAMGLDSTLDWRAVLDGVGCGVCVLDGDGTVVAANPEARRLLGDDVVGRTLWRVVRIVGAPGADAPNQVLGPVDQSVLHAALKSGTPWRRDDALFIRREGRAFPGHCTLTPAPATDGSWVVVLAFHDDSGRRDFVEELEHLAAHDTLTGLPNRLLLVDRLHQAVARAARNLSALAVLFCDLDGFKAVNDDHGHEAGDHVLVEVAQRLRRSVRPADTVARFGGDEFVVLCEELADADAARSLADRMLAALEGPFALDGSEVSLSSSIGIAFAPAPGPAPEDLLRAADRAMYQAKQAGPGRVALSTPGVDSLPPRAPRR
jgi:diguanylate cyclase (GGDEF)-like protein